jgi:tetratricopeptide (TPR) repeat protein
MEIVRSLKNDTRRGYALASVARAFAATGSIEGAVPLFYLALQDADSLVNGPHKIKLLIHILKEQTYAGRLADAFTTAGKIKERAPQEAALYSMAEILFEVGKPLEAVKIADYVPDPGMRAYILAKAAQFQFNRGDKKAAQDLLVDAVKPTGAKPNPVTLATALPLIFETQFDLRKGPARDTVLADARKLVELIPDTPPKVPVMTRIAKAEMRAQEKDAADRSLGMAWRIAWFNKDKEVFPELLSNIAMAQLNIGEVLLAFDTAARISENTTADVNELETNYARQKNPKVKTLTAIAVAAARRGDGQLALRVARAIMDPTGRASAYREIALALPAENQQAKLNGEVSPEVNPPKQQTISPAVKGSPVPVKN